MILSTKAQNLQKIKLQSATVPQFTYFKYKEFYENKDFFIKKIAKKFSKRVAVRSSSYFEDKLGKSHAGKFLSKLNINARSSNEITRAINEVKKSYKGYEHPLNEILIQEMVRNVKYSGVIFTCDRKTSSPYFKINYTKSSDTSLVTGGSVTPETFTYFKDCTYYPKNRLLKKIIIFTKEMLKVTKIYNLDIEFAVDTKLKIHLLQFRYLKTVNKKKDNESDIKKDLFKLEKKIQKLQGSHAHLLGGTTFFGVMPDWNPAEIIGFRPNPLALSLYKELITDHVWSKNRKFLGYKDVTSSHLMTTFFGVPYVDLRVDFNSWLPNRLSERTSKKLINFYLNKFKKNIYLHDKIEFGIIFSSVNFSTKKKLNELKKNGFNKKEILEIKESLTEISNLNFKNIRSLKGALVELQKRYKKIYNSKMYYIDKIYWLIEDCKMYGTYPFAGFARGGFMAIEFLESMVDQKIVSKNQKELFLNSIKNVASEIQKDSIELNKSDFIIKHGHIRPNTYDINSLNYKDGYNLYFKNCKKSKKNNSGKFNFNKKTILKIKENLVKNKLKISANEFIKFITESIMLREYSKYLFTKNVNAIIELIKKFGLRNGLTINDSSYLEISDITNLYYSLDGRNISEALKNKIKNNKKIIQNNLKIDLPEVITDKKDIYFFKSLPSKVNYIGQKTIVGKYFFLKNNNRKSINLDNKLVLIENADPGYDFIFSHKILGLITKFGGANSHMSIRCSELGIQAAIGVGEKNFSNILDSTKIEIDGQKQTIKKIS